MVYTYIHIYILLHILTIISLIINHSQLPIRVIVYFPDQSSRQFSFQGATREQPSAGETSTKVWINVYIDDFQHCRFVPSFNKCGFAKLLRFSVDYSDLVSDGFVFIFSFFSPLTSLHFCLVYITYCKQMFDDWSETLHHNVFGLACWFFENVYNALYFQQVCLCGVCMRMRNNVHSILNNLYSSKTQRELSLRM